MKVTLYAATAAFAITSIFVAPASAAYVMKFGQSQLAGGLTGSKLLALFYLVGAKWLPRNLDVALRLRDKF